MEQMDEKHKLEIYESFLESATDGFYVCNSELNLTHVNKQGLAIFPEGTKKEDLIGKNMKDLTPYPSGYDAYMEVIRTGKPFFADDVVLHPVFGERHLNIRAFKLNEGIGIITTDITERKRAEEALANEKERLTITLRSIGDGVIATDTEGKILLLNKVAEKLTGWTQDEALGKPLNEVFHIINEKTRERCENPVEKVLKTRVVVGLANDTVLVARDGTERILADSGAPIRDKDGNIIGVVLVFRDVTEKRKAEDALQKIEWLLTKSIKPESVQEEPKEPYEPPYGNLIALNTSRVLLDAVGEDVLNEIVGDYLDLLDTSAAIYETNGDYALGIFTSGWCRFLDQTPRDLCGTDDNREALASGKWHCHESCWTEASKVSIETGQPVDIECNGGIRLYAVPVWAGGEVVGSINVGYSDPPIDPQKLQEIAEKYVLSMDDLLKQAELYESRPPFIIDVAKSRLTTSAKLIGTIVELKLAEEKLKETIEELRETQEELVRKEKLAILGQLAGGVGHELRNPLGAIKSFVYFLNMALEDPEPKIKETLEILDSEVAACERIIGSLLDFARPKPPTRQKIDVNDVVREAQSRTAVPESVEVVRQLDEALPIILGDPDQLSRVFVNILLNAIQAMPEGGLLTVTSELPSQEWVAISFTDTGVGIPEDSLEKLFEPLYTTKAKGIGLGLAITKDLVEAHGGTIEVQSEVGKGSTFTVRLPTGREEEN